MKHAICDSSGLLMRLRNGLENFVSLKFFSTFPPWYLRLWPLRRQTSLQLYWKLFRWPFFGGSSPRNFPIHNALTFHPSIGLKKAHASLAFAPTILIVSAL